ncbi:MAG: SP family xylose:H+ symportor-like MFS transporter [Saprospiraceae bacterium]|jgi:SP family xylose:H+ symportor-like MFS transporter
MNQRKLFYWSVTVAVAGFLFGFDTIVISGADQPIQELWHTSDLFHGWFIMSMALWGTVFGALFGGIPCDILGRKKTLFWIGILFLVSALGSGMAWDPYSFSFFRFIGGLGVGASSVAAPTYIAEIAGAKNRGKLVALYQFNIVFGILIAFLSNYFLGELITENAWRWMLGIEAIPALIYILLVLGVPKSPRWLMTKRNDEAGARKVLNDVYPPEEVEAAIDAIKNAKEVSVTSNIFSGKYNKLLMLAFLLAMFNQLSGINFILYYAPRLLEAAGIGKGDALLQSVSIGVVNLLFTLLGMYLIDRAGRKRLMFIGSIGYIISLAVVAWAYWAGASSIVLLSFVLVFIASHAVGQGAVIWVFLSEIFPNEVRANGQAWGTGTHWVFAALITAFAPFFIKLVGEEKPWPLFVFFCIAMVFQLLFVIFMMPETKGKTLEELEQELN